ncbi:hypothetical protein KEM55_009378 [Ascosphaera atra]|nr:hypothetical protein KEM55_009378 [Ascosphaera atra]
MLQEAEGEDREVMRIRESGDAEGVANKRRRLDVKDGGDGGEAAENQENEEVEEIEKGGEENDAEYGEKVAQGATINVD